jgi:hypothetical protein
MAGPKKKKQNGEGATVDWQTHIDKTNIKVSFTNEN